jgi:polyphosphate:nucleotide phosphotransferase, PPK2 family
MKESTIKRLVAKPGEKHKVSDFKSDYTAKMTKTEAVQLQEENNRKLAKLQERLYANDRHAVLILFQAMDAAGKDGTIKHVMSGVNPQGCQVFSFKQPSSEELDHDYLWRISKSLPERGRIGIFNRSHYEDVLICKVHPEILLKNKLPDINSLHDIKDGFWEKRYKQINNFEQYLMENGIHVIKFFLNISHQEQEKRFLARLEDEAKNWKFSASDWEERGFWENYMDAYSDMLTYTSTPKCPWHVIPADHKWFMRYAVGQIILDEIEKLNPQFPVLSADAKKKMEEAKRILKGK